MESLSVFIVLHGESCLQHRKSIHIKADSSISKQCHQLEKICNSSKNINCYLCTIFTTHFISFEQDGIAELTALIQYFIHICAHTHQHHHHHQQSQICDFHSVWFDVGLGDLIRCLRSVVVRQGLPCPPASRTIIMVTGFRRLSSWLIRS